MYSVTENKILSSLELRVPYLRRCCGSSHGWLATVNEEDLGITLLNPFSGRALSLPKVGCEPYNNNPARRHNLKYEYDVKKVILSCGDPSADEFVVVAIYGMCNALAYIKPGRSKHWIKIRGVHYSDAIYHQGIFYVMDKFSGVLYLDVRDYSEPKGRLVVNYTTRRHPFKAYIVVLSTGKDLLLVERDLLAPRSKGGCGSGEGFDIMKSGDARVGLVAFPSVGKSTLVNKLIGTSSELLDIPGIIKGAKDGKGRGRQVISTARSCNCILIVLDAIKPITHKRLVEKELGGFGIRMFEPSSESAAVDCCSHGQSLLKLDQLAPKGDPSYTAGWSAPKSNGSCMGGGPCGANDQSAPKSPSYLAVLGSPMTGQCQNHLAVACVAADHFVVYTFGDSGLSDMVAVDSHSVPSGVAGVGDLAVLSFPMTMVLINWEGKVLDGRTKSVRVSSSLQGSSPRHGSLPIALGQINPTCNLFPLPLSPHSNLVLKVSDDVHHGRLNVNMVDYIRV
ncbi:hypothetical protein RHGRI_035442 [Rhododendron griersonianum]|uniref:KIB1-4 beta-propeller domain-containing protein n=1 Tax=Rhododendron griersonianum TaxID=479676 RepID=A0AAV6I807_9ERIC|nr:hypothetical protein RHGRI_035442 [Rhododendron griersonianum]